jgi:hypothetical protein
MTLLTNKFYQYFTESCQTITTHAIITDGNIPSVFTITITDGLSVGTYH